MPRTAQCTLSAILTLLIFGCLPISSTRVPSANAGAGPSCGQAGTVQSAVVPETQRGYQYAFNVYLPPCYDADGEHRYPVLYLVPGRGGGPWSWFDAGTAAAADNAIHNAHVPPFIIVATDDTDSDPQAEAIVHDLIPFVEKYYRIRAGRANHAVAGGSLGGIAAYRIAFQYPDQFASSAIFGSGLVAGEEKQFDAWLQALPAQERPRVFLNTGEQDPYMLERARVLQSMLDGAGLESRLVVGPGGHDYAYWISNLPEYFAWLARDW